MLFFKKSDTNISISGETIIKAIFFTIASLLLLKLLDNVTHQLTLIAVAAFLALALNPAVAWLTNKLPSKSRTRATAVAYLAVLVVLASFLLLVVPPLVRQTSEFAQDVPETIENLKTQDSALGRTVRRYDLDKELDEISDDIRDRSDDLTGPLVSTASRIGGTLVSIITVLVLTFMMLIEGPIWLERFLSLQAADKRAHRREIARRMYRVVTGYVNGQVLIAAIAASFALIAILIGNAIFDASANAVALAGIAFVFGLIPLFGNILGAFIVVLACLFSSGSLAVMMAIYFLVYQQIENASLQPYIQSRSNQLTPLTVFVAALLGVGFGGILGALAAIPIAGCLRILLEDYLGKRLPSLKSIEDPKN
jgi:predicted PurR-regulated permease PerM